MKDIYEKIKLELQELKSCWKLRKCWTSPFRPITVIDVSVVFFLFRNSMTSATGWYRTLLTFSQTMPISNEEICLKTYL